MKLWQKAVIIALVLMLAAVTGLMLSRVSASELVLWKQACPGYAQLTLVPEKDTVHVVCSIGDLSDDRAR